MHTQTHRIYIFIACLSVQSEMSHIINSRRCYRRVITVNLIHSPSLTCWFVPQHQQQVVQAMERAKQVTMGELNASIGVRELPPLLHSVCTLSH